MKEITFYLDSGACAESDWRQSANCRTIEDPEVFFPIGTTGPALDQLELAKEICGACRVRDECLDWAMSTNQDTGVWGGLSEEERRDLVKGRTPALV